MREGGGRHFKDISEGRCCLNICMMYSVVVADRWVVGGGVCRNIVTYCVIIFVGLLSAGRANPKC